MIVYSFNKSPENQATYTVYAISVLCLWTDGRADGRTGGWMDSASDLQPLTDFFCVKTRKKKKRALPPACPAVLRPAAHMWSTVSLLVCSRKQLLQHVFTGSGSAHETVCTHPAHVHCGGPACAIFNTRTPAVMI